MSAQLPARRAPGQRTADGRLRMPWLDRSDGVHAVAVARRHPDGMSHDRLDRRGRLRADEVDLIAANQPAPGADEDPADVDLGVSESDRRWILGADRRHWSSIEKRFGDGSLDTALQLIAIGVVELRVPVRGTRLDIEHPRQWRLTPLWSDRAARGRRASQLQRDSIVRDAAAAAAAIMDIDPGLAGGLRSATAQRGTLQVLIAAAHDLVLEVRHDGPRAFSQNHFGDTKLREDAPDILREAGASEATIDVLGLRRSPYIGLGGTLFVAGMRMAEVPGPVRFRADPHRLLTPAIDPGTRRILFVENLQAAEFACDEYPDMAIVWFAGQPSDAVVGLCRGIAGEAQDRGLPVVVAPDADLGGVRIAQRLLRAMPKDVALTVLDVGAVPHTPGPQFSESVSRQLQEIQDNERWKPTSPYSVLLTQFAGTVLARGHVVEQEAAIRAAISRILLREGADTR